MGRGFRGGKPDILFKLPEQFNGFDCRKPVSQDEIDTLYTNWAQEPILYDPELFENILFFKPNFSFPSNAREAFVTFEELRDDLFHRLAEHKIIYESNMTRERNFVEADE